MLGRGRHAIRGRVAALAEFPVDGQGTAYVVVLSCSRSAYVEGRFGVGCAYLPAVNDVAAQLGLAVGAVSAQERRRILGLGLLALLLDINVCHQASLYFAGGGADEAAYIGLSAYVGLADTVAYGYVRGVGDPSAQAAYIFRAVYRALR